MAHSLQKAFKNPIELAPIRRIPHELPRATATISGFAPRMPEPPVMPVTSFEPVAAPRAPMPTFAFVLPMTRPSFAALAGYLGVGITIGVALGALVRLVHHM